MGASTVLVTLVILFSSYDHALTEIQDQEEPSPLLIGQPEVNCQIQRLSFEIETKEPFHGRLFVKGHSNVRGCAADFYGSWSNETKSAKIEIDYHNCDMERIRSLSPKGVTYANTITVQFHRTFITKTDKSYRVRCFYAEQEKTVTSDFDVSMVPTRAVEHDMELPSCGYTIRASTPNGAVVRSTMVGDLVYHRWECTKNSEVYGMLVHSCLIEDEAGRETMMIDAIGCPVDPGIVPELTYSDHLNLAYTSTRVFKYPDDNVIKFRCQIRICMKLDNGCQGVTPPSCETNGKIQRRSVKNSKEIDNDIENNHNLDVVTPGMLVIDEFEIPAFGEDQRAIETPEDLQKINILDYENYRTGNPVRPLTLQDKSRSRLASSTSFYDALSPSPGANSSSETRRSALRRGTDTTTAALEADNAILVADLVHSNQWELCVNRIILISILAVFVLFFIGSVSFVVYVLTERSRRDLEQAMEVHDGPAEMIITRPDVKLTPRAQGDQ